MKKEDIKKALENRIARKRVVLDRKVKKGKMTVEEMEEELVVEVAVVRVLEGVGTYE